MSFLSFFSLKFGCFRFLQRYVKNEDERNLIYGNCIIYVILSVFDAMTAYFRQLQTNL